MWCLHAFDVKPLLSRPQTGLAQTRGKTRRVAVLEQARAYRVPHFQLELEEVRVMEGAEESLRSLSMERLPLSEPVGEEARWKLEGKWAPVVGET